MSDTPSASNNASLGQRAFRGFAWIIVTTFGVKCLTAVGQFVLAALLTPHDFGLIALAYTVIGFTGLIQRNGLREILVQRGARFLVYESAALWMSLATGVTVALLTIAAAPLGARIYHEPRLIGVLMVMAAAAPFLALQSVPGAKLQNDLRFRAISVINVAESLGLTGLMLLFAFLGVGPYSIVLPMPIVQSISLAWQWRMTRIAPRLQLEWSLWRELFRDSSLMLGAAALYVFNLQGAPILLGLFHDTATVGIFFFASNLVTQITSLLTNNLWAVLLPSLSKLQGETERQITAFLRIVRAVNLVGMPICLWLAAIAAPGLHLLYGSKWDAAIPVMQVLSIGMCFNISFALSINLIMAQGRFGTAFRFNFFRAAGYLALVTLGAVLGGAVSVAAATALFTTVFGPTITYVALRQAGRGCRDVIWVHAGPFCVSVLACGGAWFISQLSPRVSANPLAQLIAISILAAAIGLPLARWLVPDAWSELVSRVLAMRDRRA
jgi:O-antigen/teichoic acid export membrane protein